MNWLWLALMMSTDFLVAFQAPVNSRLREMVGSPMLSASVSFGGGLLLLLAMAAAGLLGRWGRGWAGLREAPWWAFTGGLYGAFSVLAAIFALPRLGAGLTVACSVAGWQLGALLVDAFGWFGVQRVPVSGGRLRGAGHPTCRAAGCQPARGVWSHEACGGVRTHGKSLRAAPTGMIGGTAALEGYTTWRRSPDLPCRRLSTCAGRVESRGVWRSPEAAGFRMAFRAFAAILRLLT